MTSEELDLRQKELVASIAGHLYASMLRVIVDGGAENSQAIPQKCVDDARLIVRLTNG